MPAVTAKPVVPVVRRCGRAAVPRVRPTADRPGPWVTTASAVPAAPVVKVVPGPSRPGRRARPGSPALCTAQLDLQPDRYGGSVNTSGAPGTVVINSATLIGGGTSRYITTAPISDAGEVSFDWSISNANYTVQFLVNGVPTLLNGGGETSGTYSTSALAGTIGFGVRTGADGTSSSDVDHHQRRVPRPDRGCKRSGCRW